MESLLFFCMGRIDGSQNFSLWYKVFLKEIFGWKGNFLNVNCDCECVKIS